MIFRVRRLLFAAALLGALPGGQRAAFGQAPAPAAPAAAPSAEIPFDPDHLKQELARVEAKLAEAKLAEPKALAFLRDEKAILERAIATLAAYQTLEADEKALAERQASVDLAKKQAVVLGSPVPIPAGFGRGALEAAVARRDERKARVAALKAELGALEARPAALDKEAARAQATRRRALTDLAAWARLARASKGASRERAARRAALLRVSLQEVELRLRRLGRARALAGRKAPVVLAERDLEKRELARANEVAAKYQAELDRRSKEASAVLPGERAALPFEKDPLEAEVLRLEEEIEALPEDAAPDRERLGGELALVKRGLATMARQADIAKELERVPERRQAAEALAKEAGGAATEIKVPSPFKREYLELALKEEAQLREQLAAKSGAVKRLVATPEQLRAEIKALEASEAALAAKQKERRAQKTAAAEEKRRGLAREIALVEVDLAERRLRRAVLRASVDLARKQVPIARLEQAALTRRAEAAQRRVKAYQKAEEARLEEEARVAELARLEKNRKVEGLRRMGFGFRADRLEAAVVVDGELLERKREERQENLWGKRHRELEREAEDFRAAVKRELEGLKTQEQARSYARVEVQLSRLRQVVERARRGLEASFQPALAEALRLREKILHKLEALGELQPKLRPWIEERQAAAKASFQAQQDRLPMVFPDGLWKQEEAAWDALRSQRIQLIGEREALLQKLLEHLADVQATVEEHTEEIAAGAAQIRARSYWLRTKPIVDPQTLRPALTRMTRELRALREDALKGRLQARAWRFVREPAKVLSTLALLVLGWALVWGGRRVRRQLRARLAEEAPEDLSPRVRLERASLRLALTCLLAVPPAVWAGVWLLTFPSVWVQVASLLATLALAHAGLASLLRVVLRPHEGRWRLLPVADDLALVLFRLGWTLLVAVSLFLGLYVLVAPFGDPLAHDLRQAFQLVFELGVTTIVIVQLASSPAVTGRLLGLISPRMAERLRKFLLPVSLFMAACVLAAFALEAVGYRNAADEVWQSFLWSIGGLVAAVLLDRLLFRMIMGRIDPRGLEAPVGGEEAAAASRKGPPVEPEPGTPEARQLFLRRFVGVAVSSFVLVLAIGFVCLVFGIERPTLLKLQGLELFGFGPDRVVSAGDVFAAMIIAYVTYIVYKYFRGFTTHYLLPRVGLSRGARFAISTVAGYMIVGLGAVLFLNRLHIYLGDFDWFLAAAGVGIGFGLQEILSNFVSGLIILIERPIEVGDIVTVGGLEGEITEITIRATTVKTRDNISIIVPNKEFITASVTNWTHGSPEVRLRLSLGVAYGSNVQIVKHTLREVAEQYGRVLKKPPPDVAFCGFGASSLDFELAVWVSSPDPSFHRQVRTDLCSFIDAAFRRKGIEIPFDQLDLHVRDGEVLKVTTLDAAAMKEAKETKEREQAMRKARDKRKTKTQMRAFKPS